ncbi:MAG TPA: SulP family inorganic anion transporter [Streptosporangiaceae bacterium]|nr:SulP family inorganic anion transporter [Streptosporangiaceae bacterium]
MKPPRLPVFTSLHAYRRGWARGDLVAGLTVWAVLVPEALAYASIAGVSPVVGLYAAPGALIFYAAFGSSRHLVVGPMAATAALSAAAVGEVAAGHSGQFAVLTVTLALTTGIVALIAGLLRLGFVANFISEPVLKGFIVGLALTIIVGQVPKLLGVGKGSGDFFDQLWHLLAHLGDAKWLEIAVGFASLAVVLALRRFAPVVPAPLVAVILGILAVHVFALDKHGLDIVGHISGGLPSFGLPHVPAADYLKLAGPAAGVMLVGFAEGLGAAKTYAARNGYQISPNRELIGLGAANLASGLSSGMVVNGSLSKTAVNGSAGARTQLSGLFVAVLTVVTLLFLTGLFEDLPEATLAAVVIAALVELVDFAALRTLYRSSSARLGRIYGLAARADFIAAVAAMLGVLIFDTLPGLVIGVADSLLLLLFRVSRPNISVLGEVPGGAGQWADVAHHPEDQTVPGVTVLRVESGLFFANADHVRAAIETAAAADGTRAVVVDCETMPSVDVTAARMLDQLAGDLRRRGVRLVLAGQIGQVRDMMAAVTGHEGTSGFHRSVDEAVRAAQAGAAREPAGDEEPTRRNDG